MPNKTVFFILILILSALITPVVHAQKTSAQIAEEIEKTQNELNKLGKQRDLLSGEIQYISAQINLTTLKVEETEAKVVSTQKEIEILNSRILGLDTALDHLSKLLLKKVVIGYKNRTASVFDVVFDSGNATDLISRVKYLKTAQENNQRLLLQVQETKTNFEEQKTLREDKTIQLAKLEAQLNNQKVELDNQKGAKQKTLAQTQNDERKFQQLLQQLRSEQAAIKGIISGAGTESKIRDVKQGETIASVIAGASCNSSGGHLHFIVQENKVVANPFNYLKSVDYSNCSGSNCGSPDGDPFTPSGNWNWPLNPTIELEQGYGSTWAVRNTWAGRIYSFHNGIDINGSSNNVLAVADGELFRGSYAVGCTLPYVKLVHKDSNIVTFYLHVYSI